MMKRKPANGSERLRRWSNSLKELSWRGSKKMRLKRSRCWIWSRRSRRCVTIRRLCACRWSSSFTRRTVAWRISRRILAWISNSRGSDLRRHYMWCGITDCRKSRERSSNIGKKPCRISNSVSHPSISLFSLWASSFLSGRSWLS